MMSNTIQSDLSVQQLTLDEIIKRSLTYKRVNQTATDYLDDAVFCFSKVIELPTRYFLSCFRRDRIKNHFGNVEDANLNIESSGTGGLIKILSRIYHVIIFLSALLLFL